MQLEISPSLRLRGNGSLNETGQTSATNQNASTWVSRPHQQTHHTSHSQNTTGAHSNRDSFSIIQHTQRINGRRKLSRNEASHPQTSSPTQQIGSVQNNLSIRRGITRYQHSQRTQHQTENQANISGLIMSQRNNESQQSHHGHHHVQGKLIGKNSLHMKRRSEYPDANSANQWHLPNANAPGQPGIITSESQKNTAQAFNFSKHQGPTTPNQGS